MKHLKMYCLVNPAGTFLMYTLSDQRKGVVHEMTKVWPSHNWKGWYGNGWRIRKVNVTIEIAE